MSLTVSCRELRGEGRKCFNQSDAAISKEASEEQRTSLLEIQKKIILAVIQHRAHFSFPRSDLAVCSVSSEICCNEVYVLVSLRIQMNCFNFILSKTLPEMTNTSTIYHQLNDE